MATDMTAEQAEQYVREHWNEIRSFESASGPWHICDGTEELEIWRNSEADAWLAAAEYTRSHEQKIAEKREEIDLIREYIETSKAMDAVERLPASDHTAVFERVLAMLEAQLTELLRGWREK